MNQQKTPRPGILKSANNNLPITAKDSQYLRQETLGTKS
jgi:hypothetical protein